METLETKKVKVTDPEKDLREAAGIIRGGGLAAFPTETVYGLGANALDRGAVERIFGAKGRPADNPLIIHIAEISQVSDLADDITILAQRVMEAFWPGPLTVVLRKKPIVPKAVTGGLNTVAVRMPDHPVALSLIRQAGVPVAAPSANSSGRPSPTTAGHVMQDLAGKIDMVVDGGPCRVGVESTVLDLTHEPPIILRPGAVTREDLESVIGHVELSLPDSSGDKGNSPRSPGVKYTHYAPRADMIVVAGDDFLAIYNKANEMVLELRSQNKKVGVLASCETARGYMADEVFTLGSRTDPDTIAQNLYYALRYLDDLRMDVIIAEGCPKAGIGAAIMNRLEKAAGGKVVNVDTPHS